MGINNAETAADICMFVHNDVSSDGRVLKEAGSLAAQGWKVVVVGVALGQKDLPEVETIANFTVIRITPRFLRQTLPGTVGKLLRLMLAVPAAARAMRQTRAHVYHGNDFIGLLMVALAGIWRRPVVYDSHELFFDRYPKGIFNYPLKYVIWTLRPLEKILARRAAAVMTVSDSLAKLLSTTLGVPMPVVVRNVVDLRELTDAVPINRPEGMRLVAHTGTLLGGRHLAELVESLKYLPSDVSLVLIGDGKLRAQLIEQAQNLGVADRLLTIYPVTPFNIPTTLAQADAAVVLTSPDYQIALPNKFFEAVAAGVPIIGTSLQEVKALIERYDLGVICDPKDPASIAEQINHVLQPDNLARYKANALHARAELTWEAEERKLVALYKRILG
ncbi:MAG: glycosyltransferase family 4 protein [Chloroflexota bacterium]